MINVKELKKIPVGYKRIPPPGQSPHKKEDVLSGRGTGKSVGIYIVGGEPIIIGSPDSIKFKKEEDE